MDIKLQTVTPAESPVTLADIKAHCRIDGSDDNDYLAALIAGAVEEVEQLCGVALATQTLALYLDHFPAEIRLPRNPVQSVASIQYLDNNGQTQTLAPAAYTLDNKGVVARIIPAYGCNWPGTRPQPNAVTVTFVAGHDAVPERFKLLVKFIVAEHYENREPVVVGQTVNRLPGMQRLLNLCRVWG